jgi:hypothetical protein
LVPIDYVVAPMAGFVELDHELATVPAEEVKDAFDIPERS